MQNSYSVEVHQEKNYAFAKELWVNDSGRECVAVFVASYSAK